MQATFMLDIDGHLLHTPERTETGVGLANLTYPEMTHAFVTFTPGLEVRLSSQMDSGFLVSGSYGAACNGRRCRTSGSLGPPAPRHDHRAFQSQPSQSGNPGSLGSVQKSEEDRPKRRCAA
jgi:hypothetical protein